MASYMFKTFNLYISFIVVALRLFAMAIESFQRLIMGKKESGILSVLLQTF